MIARHNSPPLLLTFSIDSRFLSLLTLSHILKTFTAETKVVSHSFSQRDPPKDLASGAI